MTAIGWKEELLPGADAGTPNGYERIRRIVGRPDLLAESGRRDRWEGEFTRRAQMPHTTSAIEAAIRQRHLRRLVESAGIDRSLPVLELGCADGLVTDHLLRIGFERLVATDIEYPSVAKLDQSLESSQHERVLLVVDDMLGLPFPRSSFTTIVAWGVLSVTGDFDRALERAWDWVAPGGWLLLAEPILESVLVYTLVRGDLAEFRRTWDEGTRAGAWETRDDRYRVNRLNFYRRRLEALPGATIAEAGGISMLPSLVLGGVAQDRTLPQTELSELSERLTDPELDDVALWRQAFWLLRKR